MSININFNVCGISAQGVLMILDFLAWGIIILSVVFIVFPIIGCAVDDDYPDSYIRALFVGFGFVVGVVVVLGIPAALIWAIYHLFN